MNGEEMQFSITITSVEWKLIECFGNVKQKAMNDILLYFFTRPILSVCSEDWISVFLYWVTRLHYRKNSYTSEINTTSVLYHMNTSMWVQSKIVSVPAVWIWYCGRIFLSNPVSVCIVNICGMSFRSVYTYVMQYRYITVLC